MFLSHECVMIQLNHYVVNFSDYQISCFDSKLEWTFILHHNFDIVALDFQSDKSDFVSHHF